MIHPKNCPFCGSSDVGGAGGQVHYYSCPATLQAQNAKTLFAVELWNERSADSEIESLQARVAELTGEVAIQNELMQEMVYTESVVKRKEMAGSIKTSKAFLLRKQAEALEAEASSWNPDSDGLIVVTALMDSASDLRKKAGELKQG